MQFRKQLAELVVEDKKKQTRRLVKSNEKAIEGPSGINRVMHNGRTKWIVWASVAIQPGRGKNAIGRRRIKDIWQEDLQDISYFDCLAEGIEYLVDIDPKDLNPSTARQAYADLWDSINKGKGNRWDDNPRVWVIEFE